LSTSQRFVTAVLAPRRRAAEPLESKPMNTKRLCGHCQTVRSVEDNEVVGSFLCSTCETEMQMVVPTGCARCGTETELRHAIGEGPTLVMCTTCRQDIDEEKRQERALPWLEEMW
jgi:hypothetical protein